jgi:hypothetical protein
MTTRKKPLEPVSGSYTPIPHVVLDSVAFTQASYSAKALLYDVLRQHTGSNNGHFQLYTQWLYKRGWKSAATIQKAKEELLERNLIVKTRWGGLNAGADYFALTWLDIHNFVGLDIQRKDYHKGAWTFMNNLSPVKKREVSSINCNSAVLVSRTAQALPVPNSGTKRAISGEVAVPKFGNNECLPLPPSFPLIRYKGRRVVGLKGLSGIPKTV